MRTFTLFTCLCLTTAATALADQTAPPPDAAKATTATLRLDLTLTDGSLLKGAPIAEHEALPLRTAFGDVSIPLSTIKGFVIVDDHETFLVSFANGDRITGFVRTQAVTVDAVLGRLDVPWSVVKSCVVQRVVTSTAQSDKPIKPIGVRASGAWSSQKPPMAIDGNANTSWSSSAWGGWIEVDLGAVFTLDDIRFTLQVSPAGSATHEVYVSDSPIAGRLGSARLLRRFTGTRRNRDVLTVDCPPGTLARYVHVRCPSSRAWFNIFEMQITPRRVTTMRS